MSQKEKIKDILSDGYFHCSVELIEKVHLVDYRARISSLRREGYDIETEMCKNRCGRYHNANVNVYRIRPKQEQLAL